MPHGVSAPLRLYKGGSYITLDPVRLRTTAGYFGAPELVARRNAIGFRCFRSLRITRSA